MALPAQGHQVLYEVPEVTAAHSTRFNVVDVVSLTPAYLARNEVGSIVTKKEEVYLCMFLH